MEVLHSEVLDRRDTVLARALARAAHHLPAQAPLEVFVHHNTLHAYQHLPFHEAVEKAREKTGAHGHLPIDEYRRALERGRITDLDVEHALGALESEPGPSGLPSARAIVRIVLVHDIGPVRDATLAWKLAELDADQRFALGVSEIARARISSGRDERAAVGELWRTCLHLAGDAPVAPMRAARRPRFFRDLWVATGNDDPSELVHAALIPVCATFLDRGQSHWSMPDRDRGFYEAWVGLVTSGKVVRPAWLVDLGTRLRGWAERGLGASGVALEILDELGIAGDELEPFVESTLLQLPGWAGMFHKLESAPGPIGRSHAKVRLLDFLAVRLVLDAQAIRDAARRAGHEGPIRSLLAHLRSQPRLEDADLSRAGGAAWPLFQLAQHAGISSAALRAAGADGAAWLLRTVRRMDEPARLRTWHEAYERNYRETLLRALTGNVAARRPSERSAPRFQVVFCIDDRGESIRRHFEELSPEHETFGAAGFFNLAIAYQGIDDPSTFPLCPVVVEPRHRIEERPAAEHLHLAEARRRWRKRLGALEIEFDRASRSILWGPLVTALAGALSAIPLLVEVFAPRFAARTRRAATRQLLPDLKTELTFARTSADDGSGALLGGFTAPEKAARIGALLENVGLTRRFAPLVAIVGHDSSSVNNPHFAAYSCGACGGRSGGPNARLFARMANRPEVRELLRASGISIPESTVFVGGVHDTCADTIRFHDVEALDADAAPALEALHRELEKALSKNAHERCRRFDSAPDGATDDEAHDHVESRSVDLSQPRPELGHATNAACVVGRRALTAGLFLDRRVFLVSYDPGIDPEGRTLERILEAVGPVCAGINLEYFFSTTDNERYGAGTKLPHNVTSLVGVMNGALGDFRTGLPRQMIEIHEPIRLQLVVETSAQAIDAILERQPDLRELVVNEWVRLILIDGSSGAACVFHRDRGFVPWRGSNADIRRGGEES